ncbi:dixin isoform 2-T2 [Gastrophryne carolinensis]
MIAYLARGSLQEILHEGFPEQQLQAYVAWVNSQLKKKSGINPVQDLRLDLRDGVVLGHLIEIVAGEKLGGIHQQPNGTQEMRENVDKVLQFMASKKIRMHQTSAKDIVDGNLKSIMRIILTLAAHFKPVSGRSMSNNAMGVSGKNQAVFSTNHRPQSTTAVAQGAAAALADVRLDMSLSGRDISRYRQRNNSVDEEIGNPYWSVRAMVKQYEGHQGSTSPSESSGLTSPSPVHSVKSGVNGTRSEDKADITVIQSEASLSKKDDSSLLPTDSQPTSPGIYPDPSWEDHLLEQQDHLEREMKEAKRMISGLQALLLNGSLPEDEQESLFSLCEDGACPEEQLVIIKGRLDQSMSENQSLKKELQNCKQENRNLQAIKDALQQRMSQQENSVLQLKQELLRANMDKDELHNQNVDLQRKTDERNHIIGECKKEIAQKDWLLQQIQGKLDEAQRKLTEANYQKVGTYISNSVQTNGFVQTAGKGTMRDSVPQRTANDLQLVRDALRSLRNSFSGHDPQHHTIDSLEQGISSLMDRLQAIETQRRQERKAKQGRGSGSKEFNEYRDSWPPNSKMPYSQSAPAMGSSNACTKVLYFTDRSLTPFMVTIPKRLGEVTLRDFKIAIDREGNYRYHFKALDPEFGTVKEEVFHDDDIIPGWEGKIVAWVEEDHGNN